MRLVVYCDGGARGNPGPAAAAFVVIDETGRLIHREGKFLGSMTNNQVEYEAVVLALEWLRKKALSDNYKIFINLDSRLLVSQLRGEFKIKNKKLQKLIIGIREKEEGFDISYHLIPREQNKIADFLVNKILDENKV